MNKNDQIKWYEKPENKILLEERRKEVYNNIYNHVKNRRYKKLREGDVGLTNLYKSYEEGAKKRKLSFNLNIGEFEHLTKRNCSYCGIEPSQVEKSKLNGDYIYNGIDRIDNNIGYEPDNCTTCCSKCNFAKHKLSRTEFINHIEKIYNFIYNRNKNNE